GRGDRGGKEWGEWAGWTGWGGWPGAAGHHGWADPEAYRDLERLAKQFSRDLRSAAWHAQAVSEDALRDLRGILDETINRIKTEVFGDNRPPADPSHEYPPRRPLPRLRTSLAHRCAPSFHAKRLKMCPVCRICGAITRDITGKGYPFNRSSLGRWSSFESVCITRGQRA